MLDEGLTQVGIGGIIAMLILREVFGFLSKKRNGDPVGAELRHVKAMVKDLHGWHSVVDQDGVKIWYMRRSFEDAIKALGDNIATQTELLRSLVSEFREIRVDIRRDLTACPAARAAKAAHEAGE
jgi:hypothetical protein